MGLARAEYPLKLCLWNCTDIRVPLHTECIFSCHKHLDWLYSSCPGNLSYVQCDDSSRHMVPKGALSVLFESLRPEQD